MNTSLQLYYFIFDTALGSTAIAYQTNPFLFKKVYLPQKKQKLLKQLKNETPVLLASEHIRVSQLARLIQDYLTGITDNKKWPSWKWLDLSGLTPLQKKVLKTTSKIGVGEVRFVGTTLAKNPFPLLIPCHRVIKNDGSPGQFGGGTALKQTLLDLEQKHT
jgi:methylated-DNA-[protein]-cysteine S-methyltransferase